MKTKKANKFQLPVLHPLICLDCGEAIFKGGQPVPCPNGHKPAEYQPEGERG